MTGRRYYFVIHYLPVGADCGLLAGRCISTLHGYVSHHPDVQIGVSFPGWNDITLGCSIAFVSINKSHLDMFRKHFYFQTMAANNIFRLSPVLDVPDYCQNVRFIRNQNLAKMFVGERKRRLARAKKRAEARGEIFQPQPPVGNRYVGVYHCAFMQSASNGQSYVLHIQKQQVDSNGHGNYNSYGLASNDIYTGNVPELDATL